MNKIVKKAISNFDFEKVHKAMVGTNWTWLDKKEPPSVGELVLCAIDLLEKAHKMDIGYSVSTGGFTATKHHDDEYGEGLSLEFIVASSEFYEGEE